MINVTGGWHETRIPQITMGLPRGGFVYLAQGIKQAVSIPVMACNRINDPCLADRILRDGQADLIGFARGLIADPELPHTRPGRAGMTKSTIASPAIRDASTPSSTRSPRLAWSMPGPAQKEN